MEDSEAITQFCAITQADPETAQRYLAVADHELETAITLFLESGGAPINDPSRDDSVEVLSPVRNEGFFSDEDVALSRQLQEEEYRNGSTDGVREAIRPVTETLVDPAYGESIANTCRMSMLII